MISNDGNVDNYKQGILKAIVNFVSLLGWRSTINIFSWVIHWLERRQTSALNRRETLQLDEGTELFTAEIKGGTIKRLIKGPYVMKLVITFE